MDNRPLWVVVPVYNEEAAVEQVIREWIPVLRSLGTPFTVCVLNDGSKDRTLPILNDLAISVPELKVVDKVNSGHGQSCIYGYRLAIQNGAAWVAQIDSDGQCDAGFFHAFWALRDRHPVIYGYRAKRDDGIKRWLISRGVTLVSFLATGQWVRDPNVPYRLIRADTLSGWIERIPENFHLANILVSVLQHRLFGIHWIDIRFRRRIGGVSSAKTRTFGRHGIQLLHQLRAAFPHILSKD